VHEIKNKEACTETFLSNFREGKGNRRTRNQMGRKTFLDWDYANNLSILDESVSKMMNFWRFCGFGVLGLKIDAKKIKSLRLGIGEKETVMLGNEKIYLVDSFPYLGSINSKDGGAAKKLKIE